LRNHLNLHSFPTRRSSDLETSSEWILVLDPKGTIREASCSARQSLGLEPARLGRVQLEDLFSPSAREAIVAWRTATWSGQARAPLEAQLSSENLVRLRFRGGPRNVDREESRWPSPCAGESC